MHLSEAALSRIHTLTNRSEHSETWTCCFRFFQTPSTTPIFRFYLLMNQVVVRGISSFLSALPGDWLPAFASNPTSRNTQLSLRCDIPYRIHCRPFTCCLHRVDDGILSRGFPGSIVISKCLHRLDRRSLYLPSLKNATRLLLFADLPQVQNASGCDRSYSER